MNFQVTNNVLLIGSDDDHKAAFHAAAAVADDMRSVLGTFPEVSLWNHLDANDSFNAILFGTADHSSVIVELESKQLLDLSSLRGKREVYQICCVEAPCPGIAKALVITGSDKRGTVYGLYHFSELCDISPLRKWSGCEPKKRDSILLNLDTTILSKEPSVKYRGFFINDEWPAFGNWATTHFGGINAKCYEQVFELILRLKGNYLWPAMWKSNFSLDGPGLLSAELADEMGIVISSSHHEPCMRAGAEYGMMRGADSPYGDAWDFLANRDGITKFWEDGLKRNAPFENVITLGMRGENDTAIMNNASLEENIALLRDVLHTQNELIKQTVNPDLSQVPRQIVLFTEVEKFYYGDSSTPGLIGDPETDGVCIMLSDSNFGYTRTLPTEEMRKHNGGYGMYYHIDMHGGAHAYEWVGTSLLSRMWEQMSMAYDYGVKDIWVVNVGDIGTQELGISYFFDLAYDFDRYGTSNPNNTEDYLKTWVTQQFGGILATEELSKTAEILSIYSRICERRKHEVMNDKVYHPVHFGETEQLLKDCRALIDHCTAIDNKYPREQLTGFWELVYFPCVATANLMQTWCYASRNRLYAEQNRNEANELADKIKQGIEFDRTLTEEFHSLAGGKFYGFGLSEHFGFTHWCEEDNKYPLRIYTEPSNKPRMIVAKSDTTLYSVGKQWTRNKLSYFDFLRPDVNGISLDIACGSRDAIDYCLSCDKDWLSFSQTEGHTAFTDRIQIQLDRSKLSGRDTAIVTVSGTDQSKVEITIHAENRCFDAYERMTFFEYDGYIAMEAEHFCDKQDSVDGSFSLLKPYGKTGSAMKVYPSLTDCSLTRRFEKPYLEYRFVTNTDGIYQLTLYFGPSTPVTHEQTMRFGISTNDSDYAEYETVENRSIPYFTSPQWTKEAYANVKIYQCTIRCSAGINFLKYYHISPNLALERLVLHPVGTELPASYLGPKESFYLS